MELEKEDWPGVWHKSATKWIHWSLARLSLKLVASNAGKIKNNFQPQRSVKGGPKDRLQYQLGIGSAIRCLILVYLMVKYSIVLCCKFNFDLDQIWTTNGSSVSLKQEESRMMRTKILESLGDPHVSVAGTSIIFYMFNLNCALFLYFFASVLVSQMDEVRFDCLAFVLEPQKHLRSMRNDMDNIRRSFLDSINIFEQFSMRGGGGAGFNHVKSPIPGILNGLHLEQENTKIKWHRQLTNLMGYLLKRYLTLVVLVMAASLMVNLMLELFLRAQRRLYQLNLNGHRPVRASALISLAPLHSNHASLYKEYENFGALDLLYLGLTVESRYFLRWRQWLTLLELLVSGFHAALWFNLFMYLLAVASLDKLVWLGQISRQLEAGLGSLTSNTLDEDEAFKLIASGYLNHLLFLARFPRFRLAVNNFILNPAMLVSLSLLGGCYLVGTHNMSANVLVNWLVFCGICLFVFFPNYFLLWPALILARMGRQVKLMSSLLAHIPSDSGHLGLRFIKHKWSKQLLSDEVLALLVAPSVFGVRITMRSLITMNSYLMALMLFLYSTMRAS